MLRLTNLCFSSNICRPRRQLDVFCFPFKLVQAIYAVQFGIVPSSEELADETFAAVCERVCAWVESRARRRGITLTVPREKGDVQPTAEIQVSVSSGGNTDTGRLWKLVYVIDDPQDENLVWNAECNVAKPTAPYIEFDLVLSIGSKKFSVQPARFRPDAPKLVGAIVDEFVSIDPVWRDNKLVEAMRLRAYPQVVDEAGLVELLLPLLESEKRTLPVVVLSPTEGGQYSVPPAELAQRLAGVSHVVALADAYTSYAFSDLLGRRLSCFDGGVRIYWPDFHRGDSPFRHKLFMRRELLPLHPAEAQKVVLGEIAEVVALRHVRGPAYHKVKSAIQEAATRSAQARYDALKNEKQTNENLKKQILALSDLVAQRDLEISDWRGRFEEVQNLARWQDAELRKLRLELDALARQTTVVVQEGASTAAPEFSTAYDVLRHIKESGAFPRLRIWASALEAAGELEPTRADRVWATLRILNQVADEYFSAPDRSLGISLRDRFRQLGAPKVALGETDQTMGRFGRLRRFSENGRTVEFQQHFTIGANGDNCIHIFFAFDEEAGVVDVGYCGPHLDHHAGR